MDHSLSLRDVEKMARYRRCHLVARLASAKEVYTGIFQVVRPFCLPSKCTGVSNSMLRTAKRCKLRWPPQSLITMSSVRLRFDCVGH